MDEENPIIEKEPCNLRVPESNRNERSFQWISKACLALPFLKAIALVYRQVSIIALIDKVLRLAIQNALRPEIAEEVETTLYESVVESKTLRALLLYDLSFAEAIIVTSVLVVVISVSKPLESALTQDYLNHMEVKRLQKIIYDKLFLSPHSAAIDIAQANDLIYNKLAAVDKYWTNVKYKIVDDMTTICSALLFILLTSWSLGLIIIIGGGIVFFVSQTVLKKLSIPWRNDLEEKLEAVSARLSDLVACRDVVLTHTMELDERTRLREMIRSDRCEMRKLVRAKVTSHMILLSGLVGLLPILFVVVFSNEINLARVFELMIIQILFYEIINAFGHFLDYRHIIEQYDRAEENICEVLGMPRETVFPKGLFSANEVGPNSNDNAFAGEDTDTHTSNSLDESLREKLVEASEENTIDLEQLTLGYQRKDASFDIIVDGMDLSISLGNRYALMGESGAGKSTLLKAMSGLIAPSGGRINLAGKAIETTKRQWREQVSVVSQDSILFNRSLRENLTYGLREGVPDETIREALRKVNLEEKVSGLPDGLDTQILENGNEFSGGQKQRLQLARLLMRDQPVVLLDEMTSALDSDSTQKVLGVLGEYCRGKTLLMITHDVTTLGLANTVLEIQRGGGIEHVCTKNCPETRDHWMQRFLVGGESSHP